MNFAGKAYVKKKPIIPVSLPVSNLPSELGAGQAFPEGEIESDLNSKQQIKSEKAFEGQVLNSSNLRKLEEEEKKSAPRQPRLKRNRSFERLSISSLNHSLNSMSASDDSDEECEMQEEADCVLDLPRAAKLKPISNKVELKIDTNVVSLDLGSLKQAVVIATGDPVVCCSCKAIFSMYSGINEEEDGRQMWKCEFCDVYNEVNVDAEEIPRGQMVDYMLMSSSQVIEEKKDIDKSAITVVFCIDISGSMCCTEPVTGKINLKNKKKVDLGGFTDFDMFEQYREGENMVTYVSRLECVQAAIEAQLKVLAKVAPSQKIGIITFNHEVTLYGDGSGQAFVLAGDKLNSFESCFDSGVSSQHLLKLPISQTEEALNAKLNSLNETGPTALGPALIAAVGQASQGLPGSKVIICTDGLANVGIGRLDESANDDFYHRASEIAKSKGIEISVISIEGEECKLSMLSKVSEQTGGEVTRVNMNNIVNEFANILETPVIATQVSTLIKLHKGLKFRYQEEFMLDENTIERKLGNVSEGTEFTFEYQMREFSELEELGINLEVFKQIPFQSQIHYTNKDGARCIRVITAMQDTTDDLDQAGNIDLKVIGVNAAQRSAHLASKGEYRESQAVMRSWKRMMKRNVKDQQQGEHLDYYLKNMSDFNKNLNDVALDEVMMDSQERVQSQKDHISHMAFRAKRAQQDNKKACVVM